VKDIDLSPTIKLDKAFGQFYLLNALRAMAKEQGNFRAQHILEAELSEFIPPLHSAMRDYLTLISFGEARHSGRITGTGIPDLPIAWGRDTAMETGIDYNPRLALPKLARLFRSSVFGSGGGYGGEKWAVIADHALDFWNDVTLQDMIISIDTSVSLVHNGGLCYQKGYIFNPNMCLYTFLDDKQGEKTLYGAAMKALEIAGHVSENTVRALRLLRLEWWLDGYTRAGYLFQVKPSDVLRYEPIKWGKKKLKKARKLNAADLERMVEACGPTDFDIYTKYSWLTKPHKPQPHWLEESYNDYILCIT